MFFLQQKSFQCLFESNKGIPENVLKKCFDRKPELNLPVKIYSSDTSLLDDSTSNIKNILEDNLINTDSQEKLDYVRKLASILKTDDNI